MAQQRKRKTSSGGSVLPTDILSNLEQTDQKASIKRKKLFTTQTLPKSLATKSQYKIHTSLIECRILLQRALVAQQENQHDEQEIDGGDTKSNDKVETQLDKLLEKLLNTRNTLCQDLISRDDSDISDDDDDNDDDEKESQVDSEDSHQKSYLKLQKRWKSVLDRHYDNMNITKRYKSTSSHNNNTDTKFGNLQILDQSFWSQVESTVKHNAILESSTSSEENRFDDMKVYQHMLQEYISLSAERGNNDAAAMATSRLRLANKKKSKTNEDVDRKASKGRKIRYVVHEKLKNFTFPVQRESNSIMDEDILFKSMLGGVVMKN